MLLCLGAITTAAVAVNLGWSCRPATIAKAVPTAATDRIRRRRLRQRRHSASNPDRAFASGQGRSRTRLGSDGARLRSLTRRHLARQSSDSYEACRQSTISYERMQVVTTPIRPAAAASEGGVARRASIGWWRRFGRGESLAARAGRPARESRRPRRRAPGRGWPGLVEDAALAPGRPALWAPLPLGSNRPWSWTCWRSRSAPCSWHACGAELRAARVRSPPVPVWLAGVLIGGALGWAWLQTVASRLAGASGLELDGGVRPRGGPASQHRSGRGTRGDLAVPELRRRLLVVLCARPRPRRRPPPPHGDPDHRRGYAVWGLVRSLCRDRASCSGTSGAPIRTT